MNLPRRSSLAAMLATLLLLSACAPVQDTPTPPPPPPTPTPVPVTVDLDEAGVTIVGSPPAAAREPGELFVVTFDAAQVVDRVMPAVVTVINEQQFNDGIFGQTEIEAGRGTGFIIDDAGHIVTNQHVVEGGTGFEVILANGENRPAELVGADPLSDLAVVRMEGVGAGQRRLRRFEHLAAGSTGAGHRLAAGGVHRHRHQRHHQRAQSRFPGLPRRAAGKGSIPISSSTTPRSTPATPAGRSSTWPAGSSGSTRSVFRNPG